MVAAVIRGEDQHLTNGREVARFHALGKVGSPADGRNLIPLLADESTEVRRRVLQALGVLRVKEPPVTLKSIGERLVNVIGLAPFIRIEPSP